MPSASNARILIAIRDKSIFLDFLDASKEIIGEAEYFKLQTRIKNLEEYAPARGHRDTWRFRSKN